MLKRRMPRLGLRQLVIGAALLWLVATVAVEALGRTETAQAIRGVWPVIGILVAGLVGLVLIFIAIFARRLRRDAALALGIGLAVLLLGSFMVGRVGTWLHLQLYRQQYEAVVQQLLVAPDDARRKAICGQACWFRSAPTWQVGFHYSHFFIGWSEIVYDPAGEISRTLDPPRRWPNLLIRAEHLSGPWYLADYGD